MSQRPLSAFLPLALRAWCRPVMLAGLLGASLPAWADKVVAGVRFDGEQMLAGQALQLNGAGLRVKMIVKVYAVGLYAPQHASMPQDMLAMPGPKSLRIVLLRDVTVAQLNEALVNGMRANASEAELAGLDARLSAFEAAITRGGDAQKGNLIQIDYLPESGTRLSMGQRVLTQPDIPGEDFYRALLRIWLGDKPSDSGLKRDLLGGA
ncbi:chalcone isomerase family protein [Aquabacterium sp.]|uniref:chalcone isomerase family protein n=1 Tax=Aquabacterium sp. TaxID=1872578 RepID=UPI0025BE3E53|nr:chalcone isomerase family protein [Aquabacterium sp.]